MKRILTNIVSVHWLVFFSFHALGSLSGTLQLSRLFSRGDLVAGTSSTGPMRAFPMLEAGLGTASLLVSVLFFWAIASRLLVRDQETADGDIERVAYGSGALVLSTLSAIALVNADPDMLMAATAYFSALILSWGISRAEVFDTSRQTIEEAVQKPGVARLMAAAASHPHRIAHIAGRERK